jgi:hypothetical protein
MIIRDSEDITAALEAMQLSSREHVLRVARNRISAADHSRPPGSDYALGYEDGLKAAVAILDDLT